MLTAAELGMLTAQKQAQDTEPKRKAKSDAAEYKKMTKDIPEEFHDIRNDMHAWLKETGKSKRNVEKSAYGGSDTGYEYDRWLDGGPAYDDRPLHRSRKRIIDMTKTLADAAKARGADVKFYGEQYADPSSMYSADEAIKRLMAAKQIDDTNESSMPNYYSMEHPRKARAGLAELLRLKTPDYMERDEAFPAGTHPLDVITEKYFKKPKIEKESGELNMHTAADLGRLSAQMHHTKQAAGWPELPSWLSGGRNPFFEPQQGMGGPVVMPGLNGGRNQLPRQQNMGGAVLMPGFNGGGRQKPKPRPAGLRPVSDEMDPRLPVRHNMPVNPAGDKMDPRLPVRHNMPVNPDWDKMDPRFGNAPKGPVPLRMIGGDGPPLGNPVPFADDFFRKQPPPKGPVPFADNFFRKQPPPNGPVPPAFELMPAIRGKGPKGNGIKTMPAPVPTDKAPKTPAIELL
jgi:hypothetical protein